MRMAKNGDAGSWVNPVSVGVAAAYPSLLSSAP